MGGSGVLGNWKLPFGLMPGGSLCLRYTGTASAASVYIYPLKRATNWAEKGVWMATAAQGLVSYFSMLFCIWSR